jgi:protein tyrosine/serine phosphatase
MSLFLMAFANLALPSPAATPDSSFDKKRFQEEVVKRVDLPNFHEVHPYLYRSGAPTAQGLQELKDKNITTLIDLRNPGERKFDEAGEAKRLGMTYISLPMGSEAPTKQQVATVMKATRQAQAHPENGAVLVHCAHGSDRTGCLIGIWRVTEDGWDYDGAYKEMRKYWFTPKFTKLSGSVEKYAQTKHAP